MKNIFLFAAIVTFAFLSCEQLAEEDTPVCKDCYSVKYLTAGMVAIDTPQSLRLCGGDVIAWQNFADSVADTTTTKYYCH